MKDFLYSLTLFSYSQSAFYNNLARQGIDFQKFYFNRYKNEIEDNKEIRSCLSDSVFHKSDFIGFCPCSDHPQA